MVQITTYFVASLALLSGFVDALPRPDSSINEPAVSAPNGTPITASSMPESTGSSDMSSDNSMSSSDYGSSSSSSNYGSSSSSYGSGSSYGSSSNYGSGSSYGSSSYGSGSSYGSSDSSSVNTWTSTAAATSTSSAYQSYSTPSYGSGSSNWGNSGYNDCVSQCIASYGAPSATYTPTTTGYSGSSSGSSSSGSGATHTVIVAPTQGVLRFIPFALNASVGDTVMFMWGANNHTVTKSSELTPCNKTADAPFSSGEQNKGFVFTQVVNDTNPTFFYCGTPTHCEKGMFGIINPPNAAGATTSMSGMMSSIAANSSDVSGYASYTNTQTSNNVAASTWGSNIDLATLPEWSYPYVAENVLYTRNLLAANPDIIQDDGSVNLGAAGNNPLMIPQDLSAVLASASPASTSAAGAVATSAAAATSPAAAAANTPTTSTTSGAITISSSKVAVGLVAAFATVMMM